MNARFKSLLLIVMLAPLGLSSGCAVLTIDVDVYKGRLTNDPGIQTQQLIAMTKTAKGVLLAVHKRVIDIDKPKGTSDVWTYFPKRPQANLYYSKFTNSAQRNFLLRINYLLERFGPEESAIASGPTRSLDFMMDEYLTAAANPSTNVDDLRFRQMALLTALAFFGESVRDLANAQMFSLEAADLEKKYRGVYHDYSLVLQAIGNSILVQVDEMKQRETFNADETERAAWQAAALKDMATELGVATTQPASRPTPRGELDRIVFGLEAAYLKAVNASGKESEAAKHLAEAIEIAHATRANRIYLRPPSAYLRANYAITSFQRDPSIGWENMLGAHAARQIPFAGELVGRDKKRQNQVSAEIDKQFWQNVNQVRVAGAGRTNYVIAKDDIGNWYVKSYSTNVEKIIASAKNLALFAAGPAVLAGAGGSDAVKEVKDATDKANDDKPTENAGTDGGTSGSTATTKPSVTAINPRTVKASNAQYETKARAELRAMRVEASKLDDATLQAWDASGNAELASGTATRTALDAVLTKHADTLKLKDSDGAAGPHIIDGMEAVKGYFDAVAKDVDALKTPAAASTAPAIDAAAVDVAKTKLQETVGKFLRDHIETRRKAIAEHEGTLEQLGV